MRLSDLEKELVAEMPLMKCGNRIEFQQRLQWLSEGMLRNHLESITRYTVDKSEVEIYQRFKSRF